MTAKEAAYRLRSAFTICEFKDAYGEPIDSDIYYDALNMAIKALEAQEPCKDAVDREELLRLLGEEAVGGLDAIKKGYGNDWLGGLHTAWRVIDDMPSAQPEIVRCKDCKHSEFWYRDKRRCFLWHEEGIDVFKDGFCNYAERRTDG